MKKIMYVLLCVMVLCSLSIYFVYANQANASDLVPNEEQGEEITLKADSKPLNKNPKPVLKGNSDKLNQTQYKAREENILDKEFVAKNNAEVKLSEYMTYEEYLKLNDEDPLTEISKDRIIYVIQIYYPDGFEHVKAGLIENCLATGLYDAETGEYIGGSYISAKE